MTSVPTMMNAIEIAEPGGPDVLRQVERPTPRPVAGELLIAVAAAGLNGGDLMQRRGLYPPPPGVTDIPGLEVSGIVAAIGDGIEGWSIGDRVCALIAGGGYAAYAVAPAVQCLPVPDTLDLRDAGGLPETLFTCWMTLVDDGGLAAGDVLLVHGGNSGIGTIAIQLARLLGAKVIATARSPEKRDACSALGAELAIDSAAEDFVARIQAEGLQANVVLDMVGGAILARNMAVMAPRGRHVSIGLLGGMTAEFPMAVMMLKNLRVMGSTLRGRTIAEKGAFAAAIRERVWPAVADGRLRPVIHAALPLAQVAEAHRLLERGGHIGKIILTND